MAGIPRLFPWKKRIHIEARTAPRIYVTPKVRASRTQFLCEFALGWYNCFNLLRILCGYGDRIMFVKCDRTWSFQWANILVFVEAWFFLWLSVPIRKSVIEMYRDGCHFMSFAQAVSGNPCSWIGWMDSRLIPFGNDRLSFRIGTQDKQYVREASASKSQDILRFPILKIAHCDCRDSYLMRSKFL